MLGNRLFHVLCHQITAVVSPAFPHLPFAADRPVEHFFPLCVSGHIQLQMGTGFCDTILGQHLYCLPGLLNPVFTSQCISSLYNLNKTPFKLQQIDFL